MFGKAVVRVESVELWRDLDSELQEWKDVDVRMRLVAL